eukprot:7103499-Alexandrium_andersonii.AAC.1
MRVTPPNDSLNVDFASVATAPFRHDRKDWNSVRAVLPCAFARRSVSAVDGDRAVSTEQGPPPPPGANEGRHRCVRASYNERVACCSIVDASIQVNDLCVARVARRC